MWVWEYSGDGRGEDCRVQHCFVGQLLHDAVLRQATLGLAAFEE